MIFRVKGGGLKAALIAILKSAVFRVIWMEQGRDGGEMSPHYVI